MKHTWKQLRTLISSAAAASLLLVSLSACQSGQPAGSPSGGDSSKPSQAVTIKCPTPMPKAAAPIWPPRF